MSCSRAVSRRARQVAAVTLGTWTLGTLALGLRLIAAQALVAAKLLVPARSMAPRGAALRAIGAMAWALTVGAPMAVVLLGCRATPPPSPPAFAAREVVERQRWQVLRADSSASGRPQPGQAIGTLVELEIRDPTGPIVFFQVLDAAGRLAGSADVQRRFSRRVPFRDAELPLGAWSLPAGVARVLDVAGPVELVPEVPSAPGADGRGR